MMAFFKDNNLSPYNTLPGNYISLRKVFNKHMENIVSVFRNVEDTQLKPTKKVLESLFEEIEEKQLQFFEESDSPTYLITENRELTYYRNKCFKKQSELIE